MKKIAIFQIDMGVGGIQKSLLNLVKNIDYSEYDVDLYLFSRENFWDDSFPDQLNIIYLDPVPAIYKFLPFDYALKHLKIDFPEGVFYDVAVDFNSYQPGCAIGAISVPAARRVEWIHNDVEIKLRNEWKYRVLWSFFRPKFKYFDEFICVSDAIVEPFRKKSGVYNRPVRVIPNYVDIEEIGKKKTEEVRDLDIDENYVNLVSVGRVCHQKGYDILLDRFADALKTRNDLRLYIIGDGPDTERLRQQAANLGIDDSAFFIGSRNNPFAYLNRMDAFVSTSRYEGQGINIMEAMAVGLPVYCSKNLEKYVYGLEGYDDMASAISGIRRTVKKPDSLSAYNSRILGEIGRLFSGVSEPRNGEKYRIAVFQNDLGVGGIQKSVINLLSNIDYDRADVDLYLFDSDDFFENRLPERLNVRYMKPLPFIGKFIRFDRVLKRYRLDFDSGDVYDLAVDFNSYQPSCALGAISVNSAKRVMWIHNNVQMKYRDEWKYRILWNAFRDKFKYFDEFVPVSEALSGPFTALSGVDNRRFTSVRNYIDVEEIRRKSEENPGDVEIDESFINFVALGKLCHQKGYDIMLSEFAKALEKRNDLRLYIIGDGPDIEALSERAAVLGISGSVFFLGNRDNPYCYMKRMDAFISTSRYEGQPLNIMEAMVIGLPLYCSRNLEAYIEGLRGYDDIAAAVAAAQREEKKPDMLTAYNREILEKFYGLVC